MGVDGKTFSRSKIKFQTETVKIIVDWVVWDKTRNFLLTISKLHFESAKYFIFQYQIAYDLIPGND